MILITKDEKVYIVFLLVLILGLAGLFFILDETNKKIEVLTMEIEKQEFEIENLKNLKHWYEELIRLQEELELNLSQQIKVLETENESLKTIRAKLTAYSPLDNRDGQQAEGNPSRTSTGRRVGKNIAAADPNKLPYGTKLEVPGYGEVEIQDTGGALRRDNKNIRIDLFHSTYKDAMKFGVKDTEVKILEWGDD